jgi:hypothetical protein
MSWKEERDGLIAQTLAFVQSVTGKRDETRGPDAIAPLPPDTKAAAVDTTARIAVEVALGDTTPIAAPRVAPKVSSQNFEPPSVTPQEPPAATPVVQRPIAQSEMANEIRARVASFRAHQERFNREREEYFAATLTRLRAAIKDMAPPRLGK